MDKMNNKEELERFMRANNISKEEVEYWKSIAKMSNDMSNDMNDKIINKTIPAIVAGMEKLNINDCNWDTIAEIFQKAKKRKNLKIKVNETLREFNDEELGGGYLYFLHCGDLIQMDLVDYSCISVCKLENIKDIEFIADVESILITTDVKECDTIWIDEMGTQM